MRYKRGVQLVFVALLLCSTGLVCGGEDHSGEEGDSANEGLEEVSIEAVEDDDAHVSPPPRSIMSSETSAIPQTTSSWSPDLTSDNSTAVATVYPDISESLSNASGNASSNGSSVNGTTTRILRVKVACSALHPEGTNSTEGGTVEIVNMTHLLHGLLYSNPAIKVRTTPSNCTVVLFYTHWCPWSAKAAPHFNALPRAFRNVRFAAIDSSVHTAINTYFGILSVPSVVLFYNGKLLAKFNETTFNVNQLAEFVSTFTDQKPDLRLNVTSADFVGPIPSSVTKGHDWYLLFSWAFIIACFFYYISRTTLWHRVLELMQNSWREAEAVASVPPQHFHQD